MVPFPQRWEVDLGGLHEVSFVRIHWEKYSWNYEYTLEVSANGADWKTPDVELTENRPVSEFIFDPVKVRKLRINISKINKKNIYASIVEVEVMKNAGKQRNPYFDVVDIYRLRWMDVPYARGRSSCGL